MVLWDCVSLFDTKEEKDMRHEDNLETNLTTRSSQRLRNFKRMLKNFKKTLQLIRF